MVKMLVAGMGCNCRAVQNAQFAMQMSSISSSANARCQQMAPPRNENTFMARSVCTVWCVRGVRLQIKLAVFGNSLAHNQLNWFIDTFPPTQTHTHTHARTLDTNTLHSENRLRRR